jgi:predicted molibdopterin-dependent oxidoreductase YjgC
VFGAGGGTSSYREIEETDCILLWGSNARETHPIFFHHLLKGVQRGAKLYAIDPRRTTSAEWADLWAGLDIGTDIALAHTMAREIIAAGLHHRDFVEHATSGFADYRAAVEEWTLERGAAETGVPAEVIREMAHGYASAPRAMLLWTLGITEHHNAVDNVVALINLALLTGHVGRYGSGVNPLRGQNNVQGGGDMGALPDRLPGFQHVENAPLRESFDRAWQCTVPPERGWHLSGMFDAMERGELRALYVIGENPARSEADQKRTLHLLTGLDCLIVQDLMMTSTAELADVVLPAAAGWCESEGTVTSSERRVQRVRRALPPPGGARDDLDILYALAKRLGRDWGEASAESLWNELRTLSPVHAGMSYARLEAEGGLQWPCWDESHPGEQFLHARLWKTPCEGERALFKPVVHDPPVDVVNVEYPLLLTTGRRLDSFNTGEQSNRFSTPLRTEEALLLSAHDMASMGLVDGERVTIRSRRGHLEVSVRTDDGVRPGLAFMTFHFPEQIATNLLTINAVDPLSGTAEFKASAVRVDKVAPGRTH